MIAQNIPGYAEPALLRQLGEACELSAAQMQMAQNQHMYAVPVYGNLNVTLAAQAMQQLAMQSYQQPYLVGLVPSQDVNKSLKRSIYEVNGMSPQAAPPMQPVKKQKVYKFKRRAKSEKKSWTRNEIILLLQAAKLLLHRDLKTITKAIYACIDRKPGKCWGRGAEKKLKRILCFQNWRTADKVQVSKLIDKQLKEYQAEEISPDSKIYQVAQSLTAK